MSWLVCVFGRCRLARKPSSGLPGLANRRLWRCCWTAAPIWRQKTRSARRVRHRHVAASASCEVAMRPAAVPGVVGPLLGRQGRERARGGGVPGAGAGRARARVDCAAVADDDVCWHGWYACWGAAGWLYSPPLGCPKWQTGGHGAAAGPRSRPGRQGRGQVIGCTTGMSPRQRCSWSRCGHLQCQAWSACCSGGGAGSAHRGAACRGRVRGGRGLR